MENKRKHLELIQDVIKRMGGNLFFLKGWSVTLTAGLLAIFAKDSNYDFIFIVYYPVLVFWILDGYFLSQERLYRALYNHVRMMKEKDIDFSMQTSEFEKDPNNSWLSAILSKTMVLFYVPILIIILILIYMKF